MYGISSFSFTTDDGETVSVFLSDAIADIDENNNVTLQVPVFADDRSGVIYLDSSDVKMFNKSTVIRELNRWLFSGRMRNYKPRLP
jgi:hypothetical protein